MRKFLKKLDKKTQWIFPFYFYAIHSFGILMFSLLITSAIAKYIAPSAEKYDFGVSLALYILLILFSYAMANKLIRKWLTVSSIGLGALYFLVRIFYLT